jgi:tetratricopeptide (TPR) repeat protein
MRLLTRHPLLLTVSGLAAATLAGWLVYSWPERYLRAARVAWDRQDYVTARASLHRYLEARPRDPDAHLLLAQLERRANNYEEAAQHLDACARHGGAMDAVELERGLAAIQTGVYNTALDSLVSQHLARPDADQYLILEALSQGLTKSYRLKEALVCLNRMIVLRPDISYAYRRRAWIYSQGEQHALAEVDYRRALEVDAGDTVARLGLAQLLLTIRHDGPGAAEQFERLWELQQDAVVALGLAQSWRACGRGEDARRLLDDWLSTHADDALVLAERGRQAYDEQETEAAVTWLRRALALTPYQLDANYTLYLCLNRLGRKAEAEECLARFEKIKEDKKQLVELTRRLQAAPDDADLRCQMAQIFLRYGEAEGLRWLLLNVQNHPDHRPSHLALADYYEKQGQAARASAHRRAAAVAQRQGVNG